MKAFKKLARKLFRLSLLVETNSDISEDKKAVGRYAMMKII
jgi:hypothetical protein